MLFRSGSLQVRVAPGADLQAAADPAERLGGVGCDFAVADFALLFALDGFHPGGAVGAVALAATDAGYKDLGIMQGFPPPADKRVLRENFMEPPRNRWAFQHIRELQPTREIWRGDGPVSVLRAKPLDLGPVKGTVRKGRVITLDEFLDEAHTDGFLVLHRGRIVFERYMNGQQRKSASTISPVQIETFYNENKERFYQEDQVYLRLIQLTKNADETDDGLKARAADVVKQLDGGASFADVARLFSQEIGRAHV